jgi:hypothetical protein
MVGSVAIAAHVGALHSQTPDQRRTHRWRDLSCQEGCPFERSALYRTTILFSVRARGHRRLEGSRRTTLSRSRMRSPRAEVAGGVLARAVVDLRGRWRMIRCSCRSALAVVSAAVGSASATVVAGTLVRNGEPRPVLLIRAPNREAAELRGRLTTAGHLPTA